MEAQPRVDGRALTKLERVSTGRRIEELDRVAQGLGVTDFATVASETLPGRRGGATSVAIPRLAHHNASTLTRCSQTRKSSYVRLHSLSRARLGVHSQKRTQHWCYQQVR